MEFVSSVSRSGGLQDGGDLLKDFKIQAEYRKFIQGKLEQYLSKYPLHTHSATIKGTPGEQNNLQSNILILFRKLREGLVASQRVDDFALEVYETSLYLSVLFRNRAQTTSIVAQLLPQRDGASGFYGSYSNKSLTKQATSSSAIDQEIHRQRQGKSLTASIGDPPLEKVQAHSLDSQKVTIPLTYSSTWLLSLLHTLLQTYPSRSVYYSQLRVFEQDTNGGDITQWLKSILTALESRNYVRFEKLTRSTETEAIFGSITRADPIRRGTGDPDLINCAISCLIADLRASAREAAWMVLCCAYRELDVSQSAEWLLRVLMITDEGLPGGATVAAQKWLENKPPSDVRRKDDGRWILCRRK